MKYIKHFLILAVFILLQLFIFLGANSLSFVKILTGVLASVFLVHTSIRDFIFFRAYFESPMNIMTSKFSVQKTIDIPNDLLYEKLLELIVELNFVKKYADKTEGSIFVTTSISWKSWGENIYI